jgi:outer membrane beta-barrel protein
MDSRIQFVFLSLMFWVLAAPGAMAATNPDELELEPLVVREPDRRQVDVDKLDTENWEFGAFGGLMNVDNFGTELVYGLRGAYHISESFFVEGEYGITELGSTSYEDLSGGTPLFVDRDMTYYNVSLGWNIFPGESFVAGRWAFKGGLYVIGGVGSTDFAGDQRFTWNAGMGYRLIATDWLALHVNVRDHVFKSDLLGSDETYHNIEFTGALTLFF